MSTNQSLLEDPGRGLFLNQDLRQGFEPLGLPQIVLETPGTLSAHLPDVAAGREFLTILRTALGSDLVLIRKVKNGPEVGYERTTLTWSPTEERFAVGATEATAKAPKQTDGIVWVEQLVMPSTSRSKCKLTPRVYRRRQGQIVCAVVDVDDAPGVLTHLRLNSGAIVVPDDAETVEIAEAGVHLKFSMSASVHDRVLTKIGINLAAHLFGADFVRRPEFAAAKRYALTGEGHVLKISADKHPSNQLGNVGDIPGIHVFCIAAANSGKEGTRLLSVMASLYGGPFETFALAELPENEAELTETIVVVVFYNENVIERFSMKDLRRMAMADGLGPVE